MTAPTVLVSDATRNPGLALVRQLGRSGIDVRGADARRLPFGLRSRYSQPYLDYGPSSGLELPEALLEAVRASGSEVLIPVSTSTTQVVSGQRDLFSSVSAVNVPRHEAFLTAVDNERTIRTCTDLGIPCPRLLDESEALDLIYRRQGSTSSSQKVVIKPRSDLGEARGVSYPSSVQELQEALRTTANRFGEFLLQEYIPGDASTMRLVLLLFDRSSQLVAYLTSRKILQWPESGGLAALAVSTHEPELVRMVRPFFEHLGWQGPAEAELKYDSRDGLPKVIEVNPRLPSYMGFPERCGLPLSTMLVATAKNRWQGPICPSYKAGIQFFRSGELLKVLLTRLGTSEPEHGAVGQAWSELTRQARPANLDFSDPLPRIGKLLCEIGSFGSSGEPQVAAPPED